MITTSLELKRLQAWEIIKFLEYDAWIVLFANDYQLTPIYNRPTEPFIDTRSSVVASMQFTYDASTALPGGDSVIDFAPTPLVDPNPIGGEAHWARIMPNEVHTDFTKQAGGHIDFDLGLVGSGADLELPSLTVVPGVPFYINELKYRVT